jgi:hypothetical protein
VFCDRCLPWPAPEEKAPPPSQRRAAEAVAESGGGDAGVLKTIKKQPLAMEKKKGGKKQQSGVGDRIHIPSLSELMHINDGFRRLHVKVSAVKGKGLGLVAQQDINEGVHVAYYLTKLYKTARLQPSLYLLGSGVRGYTGGLFAGSFPPPGADGVPFVAPFANEPTGLHGEPNCEIADVPYANRWQRKSVLVTTKPIPEGAEITWDYGMGYGRRSYPSKYN